MPGYYSNDEVNRFINTAAEQMWQSMYRRVTLSNTAFGYTTMPYSAWTVCTDCPEPGSLIEFEGFKCVAVLRTGGGVFISPLGSKRMIEVPHAHIDGKWKPREAGVLCQR